MVEKLLADASPQKRLFISLITRDISLADAMLDLIDNSINAALEPMADNLRTADDYQHLLADTKAKPKVHINLRVNSTRIAIDDDASGISLEMAQHHVFTFGRETEEQDSHDRLSVYGIGLKRAIFKCGNAVTISSDHRKGGFDMKLPNVRQWAAKKEDQWRFPITGREPTRSNCGTHVTITQLHDEVLRRIDDGLFLPQLRDIIARTYSVYIGRVVEITLNNHTIEREPFEIDRNRSSQKFKQGTVTCNVQAGIAVISGERFRERNAGWYVFCNGRAVLFADKSTLTGWGAGLPLFHAGKYRPFLGTVFFVSPNAESLPWTTTKSDINEESAVWQEAKRHMVTVGRTVTNFLDSRYTEEGTLIASSDLRDASHGKMSVLDAAVANASAFRPPTTKAARETKIQYWAKISDVKKIETHLGSKMGGSAIGRHTFNFYLKNEVGDGD